MVLYQYWKSDFCVELEYKYKLVQWYVDCTNVECDTNMICELKVANVLSACLTIYTIDKKAKSGARIRGCDQIHSHTRNGSSFPSFTSLTHWLPVVSLVQQDKCQETLSKLPTLTSSSLCLWVVKWGHGVILTAVASKHVYQFCLH